LIWAVDLILLNWHRIFLGIVHSHDSPQDPLRFLLENIIPMLKQNIINEKIVIVASIVDIYSFKFNIILKEIYTKYENK